MIDPRQCTLYSGGHRGTESEFGTQAEKWEIQEVNFTFEGQQPARVKGLVVLGADELKKGDVSMEIVSLHMNRSYARADKIRKVIQTIFHMVNNGIQVLAVGWIQPDETVKGGTGWAVELAKLFNRPLSVFDQEHNRWFTWKDKSWVEDQPIVAEKTFVGTGTRNLTQEGRQAIHELFERSFSTPAKS
ncbi:MAG: hypothetical protein ACOWWM_08390 [Desulfobacterales bacterium]|jgi:hypothetical protein